jgi:Zn-dependent metalloprotease
VYAKQPLSRADYFIDAKNGNYLGKKDKLFYTDATGTAATAYSGSQNITAILKARLTVYGTTQKVME